MNTNQEVKVLWCDEPESHLAVRIIQMRRARRGADFQSAVSPNFIRRVVNHLRPADCKSAISQGSTLRYFVCGSAARRQSVVMAWFAAIGLALTGCGRKNENAGNSPAHVENGQVVVERGSLPAGSLSLKTAPPPDAGTACAVAALRAALNQPETVIPPATTTPPK
jgi:hypothetical protein